MLCKGGCGFFGNPNKGDYCSVCAKKFLKTEGTAQNTTTSNQTSASTKLPTTPNPTPNSTTPNSTSNLTPNSTTPNLTTPNSTPNSTTPITSSSTSISTTPITTNIKNNPSIKPTVTTNNLNFTSFAQVLSSIKPTDTGEKKDDSKSNNVDLANQLSMALKSTGVDTTSQNVWSGLSAEQIKKKQQEEVDFLLSKTLSEQYNTPPVQSQPSFLKPSGILQKPSTLFYKQKNENTSPPTKECIQRIMSDMKEIIKGDNPYLFVSPDEDDITHMNALIIGPSDSPYAHGFFHFDFIFPFDYPWNPPKVQLQTTDGGSCRFNPNLYANGKVCLSILGTWSGPGWTQIQTITSTMLSIQSLMNSKPYHNEPGFETERKKGDVERYNQCITHETIRVAVIGMLENPTCGPLFKDSIEQYFLKNYQHYEDVCFKLKDEFDGKPMKDPFGEKRGNFQYGKLLEKLRAIKKRLEETTPKISSSSAPSSKTQNSSKSEETKPEETKPNEINSDTKAEEKPITSEETSKTDEKKPEETSKTDEKKPEETSKTDEKNPEETTKTDEKKPEETSKTDEKKPEETSKSQLDLDEEFARKLQEELNQSLAGPENNDLYNSPYPSYPPFGGYHYPPHQKKPITPNFTPIKPDLNALKSNEPEKVDPDFDPKIVCIICHQSPKEYIVLPNCQQPHVYCMNCADKMIKQPSSNPMNPFPYGRTKKNIGKNNNITCALCGVVSNFDSVGGLNSLKRKRRQKMENRDKCAEHKDEDISLFCVDCMELICPFCTGLQKHKNHKSESLENGKTQVQKILQTQLNSLDSKEKKCKEFIETIEKRSPELVTGTEKAQKDLKTKFENLRKLLDEKEKQMSSAIEKMHKSKEQTLEHEKKTSKSKIEVIQGVTFKIQSVLSEENPKNFLQRVEEIEEEVRHSTLASDPEIKPNFFSMPQIYTQRVEQDLNYLSYKERPHGQGSYYDSYNDEEYYSDQEEFD